MNDTDLILNMPRYLVRYVVDSRVHMRTFFEKERARKFAVGKRYAGKAARVEVVKR